MLDQQSFQELRAVWWKPLKNLQDIFHCYFGSLQLVIGLMRLTPQLPASEPPSLPGALFSFQISFKQLDCYLLTLVLFLFFPLDFSLSFLFPFVLLELVFPFSAADWPPWLDT